LELWIAEHENDCFEAASCSTLNDGSDSENEADEGDENLPPRKRKRIRSAILAHHHYSSYAQSLVLVARKQSVLKRLSDLTLTVHCLVKGYHKPRTGICCDSITDGIFCSTRATSLDVVPSVTAGHISLLVAHNDQGKDNTWIAPRQFRRHLDAGGWPILGNAKDAYAFRGESLCLSVVTLEFSARGVPKKQCISIPPAPKLRILLEREERLWRERRGQEALRVQLFLDIPKPPEYVSEKATFDGLEFRVTPAVMIPRKATEALVERAVAMYEEFHCSKRFTIPTVLDLGTGSGCVLVSILHRMEDAYGVGVDASSEALEVADYNIAALGVAKSAHTVQFQFKDLHLLGPEEVETFNLVVCNPPYHTRGSGQAIMDAANLAHEPDMALFVDTDEDYLENYRTIVQGLLRGNLVPKGGVMIFEVCRDNAEAVKKLMIEAGLEQVNIGEDSSGCIRTVDGIFPDFAFSDGPFSQGEI
jgi:release factor glutamine methyltransferase